MNVAEVIYAMWKRKRNLRYFPSQNKDPSTGVFVLFKNKILN